MTYNSMVYNVMIASPSDIKKERQIIKDLITEWNIINSFDKKIVLLCTSWDTHSSPELGARPQEIINQQVLEKADLLIGIFWTRLGTPTGKSISGTVEEIEEHINSEKPVMLYFSSASVNPESVNQEQYELLIKFKNRMKNQGLIEEYNTISDFKNNFRRQLSKKIIDHEYFKVSNISNQNISDKKIAVPKKANYDLTDESKLLLIEAALSKDGYIYMVHTVGGLRLQTNKKNMVKDNNPRNIAKWENALNQLINKGLILSKDKKNQIFKMTRVGYEYADIIKNIK